ncbi:MAG: hypothetical protein WBC93_16535 [Sulfitobacter sp.]
MQFLEKTLLALLLCGAFHPTLGRAQNSELTTIGGLWDLFSAKCTSFVSDPNLFVQSPNLFKINDWKWIMRAAESVGFIEYFTLSPDNFFQFTAIGNATSQGTLLHCSLSGSLPSVTTADETFNAITLHFSNRNDLTVSSDKIAFFGDPSDVAELKEYYSTSHLLRVEGGFGVAGHVATIRIDDGGSVYFEIETDQ